MNKFLRLLFLCVVLVSSGKLLAQDNKLKVTDFTVSAKEKKVVIDWKTDGAESNNYFAIQKSIDGINYKTIALVLGPDPKKDDKSYGAFDKNISTTAKQYYRLVQVNPNGTEEISETKILAKA